MWWKLLLLTVYFLLLFLLSRFLETVAYFEDGYLSSRLLDPVSLSVKKLKTLLDHRGVSYAGVVEKNELYDLVNGSGEVTESEVQLSQETTESSSTNFTCGAHFYEQVEDCKDSVWVVQVISDPHNVFMDYTEWRSFVQKVSRFGIRTGIFDCSLDHDLCKRKKWASSRLVMAMPQGKRVKDNVILRNYLSANKVQSVLDWVNLNLASRIHPITSLEMFKHNWLAYGCNNNSRQPAKHPATHPLDRIQQKSCSDDTLAAQVRIVLFSCMSIPPMFFAALSVKFSGRAKFGVVDMRTASGREIVRTHNMSSRTPVYLVLTPEGNMTFGGDRKSPTSRLDPVGYRSLNLLLRLLHPEVNDAFLVSLILVNALCWLDLFITPGCLLRRLGVVLWSVGTWNCSLILLWLPVIGLFQLPYMDALLEYAQAALRLAQYSELLSVLRCDWLGYTLSAHYSIILVLTFLAFASLVGALHVRYFTPLIHLTFGQEIDEELVSMQNNNSEWWNFNWNIYVNSLLMPVANLTRPVSPTDTELEAGMELLIERLAVPNFWLHSLVSSDYIKDLPLWHFCSMSCPSSDTDSGTLSGYDSDDSLSYRTAHKPKYMFTCEKCQSLEGQTDNCPVDAEELQSRCARFVMDGNYNCACQGSNIVHTPPARSRTPTKRHINIDSTLIQRPLGMLEDTECSICLESYRYGVVLCGLPCSHSFHQECIAAWLQLEKHCCPVCRWPTYKPKPCVRHQGNI